MASITKRKTGFQVRIRRRGYPTLTKTLGTLADARRWARDQEVKVDLRTLPDTLKARHTTLSDAIEHYRENITPRHNGATTEQSKLDTLAAHPIATMPLAEITDDAIEAYIDDRLKVVAGSTVNRELGLLNQILKRARKKKWMVHNPMLDVDRPANNPSRKRRLTDYEFKRFIVALKKTRNKVFRAFIAIAFETGMRRGELVDCEWRQVSIKYRTIYLKGDQTKNGDSREVPLTLQAVKTLEELRKMTGKHQKVFGDLTRNAVKKCWQRLRERAHVTDFRLHDLRHERVSSLVEAGWNPIEAMAVSGHKDMAAFRRYAHPSTQSIVRKLDMLPPRFAPDRVGGD